MKHRTLDDFLNPERRAQLFKQQILLRSTLTRRQRCRSYKKRTPEETYLLMKVIERDVKRLVTDGILEKHGRKWKFHF